MKIKGFTLLELIAILAVMSVLATIAYPVYSNYARKSDIAVAQKEIALLATQLERYKSKNFSYQNFDAAYLYTGSNGVVNTSFMTADQILYLPLGSNATNFKYKIIILDAASLRTLSDNTSLGQKWVIYAMSSENIPNPNLLMRSDGVQCKTQIRMTIPNRYLSCGDESEAW